MDTVKVTIDISNCENKAEAVTQKIYMYVCDGDIRIDEEYPLVCLLDRDPAILVTVITDSIYYGTISEARHYLYNRLKEELIDMGYIVVHGERNDGATYYVTKWHKEK